MNVVAAKAEVAIDALGGHENLIERLKANGLSSQKAVHRMARARQAAQVRVIRDGFGPAKDINKFILQQRRIQDIVNDILAIRTIAGEAREPHREWPSQVVNSESESKLPIVPAPMDMALSAHIDTPAPLPSPAGHIPRIGPKREKSAATRRPARKAVNSIGDVPAERPQRKNARVTKRPAPQAGDSTGGVPKEPQSITLQMSPSLESIREYWHDKLQLENYPGQNEFNLVVFLMEESLGASPSGNQLKDLIDYAAKHKDQQIPLLFGHIDKFIEETNANRGQPSGHADMHQSVLGHSGGRRI